MKKTQAYLARPFIVCAFLLAGVVIWQAIHSQRLTEIEDQRQHVGQEIQHYRHIVYSILDAETGQRGYFLTGGNPAYLEPYTKAKILIERNFADLIHLRQSNPEGLKKIQEIEKIKNLKMAELDETIRIFQSGQKSEPLRIVLTDAGKKYMDALRGLLDTEIETLREKRIQIGLDANASIRQGRNGLIGMTVLIFCILFGVYWVVARAEGQRAEFARRLEYAATHDQLTGLPNRHFLKSEFAKILTTATEKNYRLVLCYIDLDNFKNVNDTFGHEAGDQVLQGAVKIFKERIGDDATLVRLGGDEFALVLMPAPAHAEISRLTENLISDLHQLRLANGSPAGISASIGVAVFPEDSVSERELFQAADHAMYDAKRAGRARVIFSSDKAVARMSASP